MMQELFDMVAGHLLRQAKMSKNLARCLYRGPEGLKCAVGCLISDENYKVSLEGLRIHDTRPEVEKSLGRNLAYMEVCLLSRLQEIHDGAEVDRWPELLRETAMRGNLKYVFSADEEKDCRETKGIPP